MPSLPLQVEFGENTLSRGRETGGMASDFVSNVNTVYEEPTTAFEALFSFGGRYVCRTASEPIINDYFRECPTGSCRASLAGKIRSRNFISPSCTNMGLNR